MRTTGDMASDWRDDARRRLLDLRGKAGAWGYRRGSAPAIEATGLAGLALLGAGDRGAAEVAGRWLATIRRGDGSLGVTAALPEPGWATPTGLLLWSALGGFEAERAAATRWLLAARGKPLAKAPGDPFGHDTTLVGWPWVAGTHSWVEPTASALLALAREGQSGNARCLEGVRLLRDRAIPGGGWNLGNPVVFNTPLRPLPGPTGLALLALAGGDGPSTAIRPALGYLGPALASTLAPISLGWGTLGLRAWGGAKDEAPGRLELAARKATSAVELALLLLADGPRSLDLLGVAARKGAG